MKFILLIALLCITFLLQAQHKLVFTQNTKGQTVEVKNKDLVRLMYNGYMQSPQEAAGFVSAITDSTVTLSPRKKLFQKKQAAQTLLIKDISGFRKYSKFRPAGEIIYGVLGIGITGAVSAIISNSSSSTVMSFVGPVATGMVTATLRNLIFSDKVKNHTSGGWSVNVVPATNAAVQ